ncbi:uncharacterized protein LOC113305531 [Papaver somniferum]|uniref:uncharacterized protein LOC113305531 n=1 Tax=Papaver somniferum TaxID=3469 RepID=UPI000E6FA663|nr:uncharacterized protein LOC113305531 [Papaver somniferum]
MPKNVSDLISSDGYRDMNIICKYTDSSFDNAINYVAINLSMHDRIRWKSTISGNLTTKSAYNYLTNLKIDKNEANFWKKIWSLNVLPKVNMFYWKVVSNTLAIGRNMSKYVKETNPYCLLCDANDVEDEMHLFVNCLFTRKVWNAFDLNSIYNYGGNQDIMHWFTFWLNNKAFNDKHNLVSFIIWSIWKFINSMNFDNLVPDVQKLIDLVKASHQKLTLSRDSHTSHVSINTKKQCNDNHIQDRCSFDWFIYFDASFLEAGFTMG